MYILNRPFIVVVPFKVSSPVIVKLSAIVIIRDPAFMVSAPDNVFPFDVNVPVAVSINVLVPAIVIAATSVTLPLTLKVAFMVNVFV